jgi:hypothetical protein
VRGARSSHARTGRSAGASAPRASASRPRAVTANPGAARGAAPDGVAHASASPIGQKTSRAAAARRSIMPADTTGTGSSRRSIGRSRSCAGACSGAPRDTTRPAMRRAPNGTSARQPGRVAASSVGGTR